MSKQRSALKKLTECAILLAIGTVLCVFKLMDLPYGGSVTLASMLPLLLISYRFGVLHGTVCGIVYGLIQMFIGLNSLSYFTSPLSIVAIIVLDYLLAYAFVGIGGIFRKAVKSQSVALALGGLVGCFLRYLCHVISGCTVWAGVSIPTVAALWYSAVYNASFMIPETVVLVFVAFYIGRYLDFSSPELSRIHTDRSWKADLLYFLSGASLVGCFFIFFLKTTATMHPQEEMKFDLQNMIDSFDPLFMLEAIIGAAILFFIFFTLAKSYEKKSTKGEKK